MGANKPPIRIALVDDDDIDRMLLQRPIKKHMYGCEFLEAASPDAALALLKNNDIDLIFIDVNLGPHDGLAFGETLRAMNFSRTLKIIFLSGHVRQQDKVRAQKITPYPVMTKPMAGAQSEAFGTAVAAIING